MKVTPSLEVQESVAVDLRRAVGALNAALVEAAEHGIHVEIDTVDMGWIHGQVAPVILDIRTFREI